MKIVESSFLNDERWGVSAVVIAIFIGAFLIPEVPWKDFTNNSNVSAFSFLVIVILNIVIRIVFGRGSKLERYLLTYLLVAMQLYYTSGWIDWGEDRLYLLLELVGVSIFGLLALTSFFYKPVLLPIGIILHGVWDLFHINQNLYTHNWYVIGCFFVDIGVGLYCFAQLKYWGKSAR